MVSLLSSVWRSLFATGPDFSCILAAGQPPRLGAADQEVDRHRPGAQNIHVAGENMAGSDGNGYKGHQDAEVHQALGPVETALPGDDGVGSFSVQTPVALPEPAVDTQ